MAEQNIFDDKTFFENYKELRNQENNYNVLLEQPAMKKFLPDLKNKKVLDLGCGFGENCKEFISMGATKVLGIDISEKMLEEAVEKNSHESIEYKKMSMEEINSLVEAEEKFDLVYSSLAFHYVEKFDELIKNIYKLLNKDGVLLFSQEHPFTTAPKNGWHWTKNENGEFVEYGLSNYMENGHRKIKWIINNIDNYHRTFTELVTTLLKNNFTLEELFEPLPTEENMKQNPKLKKEIHAPCFLIIKAKKI